MASQKENKPPKPEPKTPYDKLGKETRDLFEENYNVNQVKVDVKNNLTGLCGFEFTGTCDMESGDVKSALKTTYDFSKYYFKSGLKWTTDNEVNTEMTVQDATLCDGLRAVFRTRYDMKTSKKGGSITAMYDTSHINMLSELTFQDGKPVFNSCAVYKYTDLIFGGQCSLDIKSGLFVNPQISVGYVQSGLSVLAQCDNVNEFKLNIFKRVSSKIERGLQLHLDENKQTKLGFACQHIIDGTSALKSKIDSTGIVGLAYLYQYKPGVKCALSAQVEAKNILNGGHKLGFGVSFSG